MLDLRMGLHGFSLYEPNHIATYGTTHQVVNKPSFFASLGMQ